MTYPFITEELPVIMIMSGRYVFCQYHLFLKPKKYYDGHKFKDDREVEADVKPWLRTQ
jgi:hypothetical protein